MSSADKNIGYDDRFCGKDRLRRKNDQGDNRSYNGPCSDDNALYCVGSLRNQCLRMKVCMSLNGGAENIVHWKNLSQKWMK